MGILKNLKEGTPFPLEVHNLVGRSPHCSLRLSSQYVSNEHISIDWTDGGWYVRDLGTTNGTFVNGNAVRPGGQTKVHVGEIINIGENEDHLQVIDTSPPCPMIVSVSTGKREVRVIEHGTIVLPSTDDPALNLYEEQDGFWALEQDGNKTSIESGTHFSAYGNTWRLSVPIDGICTTLNKGKLLLENAVIDFYVSDDEETVEICVKVGSEEYWMQNRSCNYLLLTLARERLDDAESNGWLQKENIQRMLKADEYTVNVWIFRARKHFSNTGLLFPAKIIERQNGALRIGGGTLCVKHIHEKPSDR